MRWTHTQEIDTPVDTMWQVTMDVEALPSMTPTMTAVERLTPGDLRPGSQVRIKQPAQPARTWTVTETRAPHRFVWQTKVGLATMVATHELVETVRGTGNTLTLELTGPGSGLLARLIGGKITETLATENAGFKRTAEALKS